MTCSPFDLKDYFFGELGAEERKVVERHMDACEVCRDEIAALGATRSAILCMREEEPPRRIAFVSDKVFEPRWWQKLLASGPRLGFASAAMLAGAMVFHALHAPASVQAPAPLVAQVDEGRIQAEVAKRVQAAVDKAMTEREARQTARILDVVNARIARSDERYEMDVKTFAEYMDRMQKRSGGIRQAAYYGEGQ